MSSAPFATTAIAKFTAIPASDWELINRRAGLIDVGLPMGGLYYDQFAAVPNLQQLIAECGSWKKTTWPSLGMLATQLEDFARKLASFLALVEGGGGDVATLTALGKDAKACTQATRTFTGALGSFASTNANADGSPQRKKYPNPFGDLATATDAVGQAGEALTQGLGSIEDDIEAGIEAMHGAKHGFGKFMSKVELQTAVADWNAIAAQFTTTVATIGQASRELTGDARYDGVPVDDGGTYYITIVYSSQFTAYLDGDSGQVWPVGKSGQPSQTWVLKKAGWGYWTISNGGFGTGHPMTVTEDGQLSTPCLQNVAGFGPGLANGLLYRVVPIYEGTTVTSLRVVNAGLDLALQEEYALQGDWTALMLFKPYDSTQAWQALEFTPV